ncbi:MAG TPA: S1 RNA-binding domain-containing protein, partial [Synergistetes bacterium]|nr:S1 RNA-binding domain-containing protein [Synergistota bacterium]
IGVGQYQHDVDQKMLVRSLEDVVVSCVNSVGVDLNTASPQLLSFVSGLGPGLAGNIISWRNTKGPFRSRSQLKDVPRLGPRAYEQAAGFLRVRDGENPLDGSAVHPDHYGIVKNMASDLGCSVSDLLEDETLRDRIEPDRYICSDAGLPTLKDILAELAKPGRDPRKSFETVSFSPDVKKIEDLLHGMELDGVVTNVTAFGAFVDVGVHQDGLVHVSRMADRFVKDPGEIVKTGQKVRVTVLETDLERSRISLSMRKEKNPVT